MVACIPSPLLSKQASVQPITVVLLDPRNFAGSCIHAVAVFHFVCLHVYPSSRLLYRRSTQLRMEHRECSDCAVRLRLVPSPTSARVLQLLESLSESFFQLLLPAARRCITSCTRAFSRHSPFPSQYQPHLHRRVQVGRWQRKPSRKWWRASSARMCTHFRSCCLLPPWLVTAWRRRR